MASDMKGRHSFTQPEIDRIRELIHDKATADRATQKVLRDEMRSIGFYITNYRRSATGFTVADFDKLLREGSISIVEDDSEARVRSSESIGEGPETPEGLLHSDGNPRDDSPLSRFAPDVIERCFALQPQRIILIKVTVYDAAFAPLYKAGLPVVDARVPFRA